MAQRLPVLPQLAIGTLLLAACTTSAGSSSPGAAGSGAPAGTAGTTGAAALRFTVGGAPGDANVKALLAEHDAKGAPTGVRSVLVQLPATILAGDAAELDVAWSGTGSAPGAATMAYANADLSSDAPEIVSTS